MKEDAEVNSEDEQGLEDTGTETLNVDELYKKIDELKRLRQSLKDV